jgi:hypothetical protein
MPRVMNTGCCTTVYPRGREGSPHDGAQTSAARRSLLHHGITTAVLPAARPPGHAGTTEIGSRCACSPVHKRPPGSAIEAGRNGSGLRYPWRYRLARSDTEVMAESALSSSRVVVASGLR